MSYNYDMVSVGYLNSCLVWWLSLLRNPESSSAIILFFPVMYSISGLYSSVISFHLSALSVFKSIQVRFYVQYKFLFFDLIIFYETLSDFLWCLILTFPLFWTFYGEWQVSYYKWQLVCFHGLFSLPIISCSKNSYLKFTTGIEPRTFALNLKSLEPYY